MAGADKSQSEAISTAQQLEMQHAKLVSQIDKIDAKIDSLHMQNWMEWKNLQVSWSVSLPRHLAEREHLRQQSARPKKYMNRFVNRVKGLARRFLYSRSSRRLSAHSGSGLGERSELTARQQRQSPG